MITITMVRCKLLQKGGDCYCSCRAMLLGAFIALTTLKEDGTMKRNGKHFEWCYF